MPAPTLGLVSICNAHLVLIFLAINVRVKVRNRSMDDESRSNAPLRSWIENNLTTDSEFEAFCLDYFPEIQRKFGSSQDHQQKLNLLLSSVEHERIRHALAVARANNHFRKFFSKSHQWEFLSRFAGKAKSLTMVYLLLCIIWLTWRMGNEVYNYLSILRNMPAVSHRQLPAQIVPADAIPSGRIIPASDMAASMLQFGIENSSLQIFRILSADNKLTAIGINVDNIRTGKRVLSVLIPISEFKAWTSDAADVSFRYPAVRELSIEISRLARNVLEMTDSEPVGRLSKDVLNYTAQPAQTDLATARRKPKQVVSRSIASQTAEPSVGLPSPATSLRSEPPSVERPEKIEASVMMSERVFSDVPELPHLINSMWKCSRVTVMHSICVNSDGLVSDVHTIKSIPGADEVIRQGLMRWRFRKREKTACFVNELSYIFDAQCATSIELPDWKIGFTSLRVRTVFASSLRKDRISGIEPRLPASIISRHPGATVVGIYRICLSAGGVVFNVWPIQSIDRNLRSTGADASVVAALKTWKYEYHDFPVCMDESFIFHL